MESQKILQIHDVTTEQLREILCGVVKNEIAALRDELSQQSTNDKLLSPDEVCEMLGISKVTLWSWNKAGKLTVYGIGGKRWYKESEILNQSLRQQK